MEHIKASQTAKEQFNLVFFSGGFFLAAAHLYRWTNQLFNHDSLLIFQEDTGWQISLGRILIPVYVRFRGMLVSPMPIALLGSLFLLLAIFLIFRILHIEKKSSIVLCTGLLTTFEALAFLNAMYLPWFDVQMLSLLFAGLAAYCLTEARGRFRFPLVVVCGVVSLCLYQASAETLLVLLLLALTRDLLTGMPTKQVFQKGLQFLAILVLMGLCYALSVLATWKITGIEPADFYNSLTVMNDLPHTLSLKRLWRTWAHPLYYLSHSEISHQRMSALIYALIGLLALVKLLLLGRKQKLSGGAWLLLGFILFVLLPFGSNLVFLLDGGLKYAVMTYSYSLYVIGAAMIFELVPSGSAVFPAKAWHRYVVPVLCSLLILNHITFSNSLYLKKDLEYQTALSFFTRMADRMEQTEGYRLGETPVAIVGDIMENPLCRERADFDIITYPLNDNPAYLSATYRITYENYFKYILDYPIRLVSLEELRPFIEDPALQDMQVFPAADSVRMSDGTIVIRISENMWPRELR